MDALKVVEAINTLLPGFLAAWVFYGLTAHPKKEPFERVIQALVFTAVIKVIVVGVNSTLLRIGDLVYSFGPWSTNVEMAWSLGVGAFFGLIVAGLANNNKLHGILSTRRFNLFRSHEENKPIQGWVWTRRTAYPSEWFSAFHEENRYVVLHLIGERRLYGWAEEWPDHPDNGHFVMTEPAWLLDNNDQIPQLRVNRMLVRAADVEMVEFAKYEEELTDDENKQDKAHQAKLIALHKPGDEKDGKQSATAIPESQVATGGAKVTPTQQTNGTPTAAAGTSPAKEELATTSTEENHLVRTKSVDIEILPQQKGNIQQDCEATGDLGPAAAAGPTAAKEVM